MAKNNGIYTVLCAFPAQKPCKSMVLNYVGFKVATKSADPSTEVRLFHTISTLFHGARFKVCSVAFCLLDFYQGYL